MWDFLNVLKQTFLKRYVAVVVSLGIGGLLAWSVPHGRKPEPVAKSVTESTTDAATAPLHHEIALLGERIVTLSTTWRRRKPLTNSALRSSRKLPSSP
jgi:hypothetical protein